MDSPVHLTFQKCLAFHTEDDTESQKNRFQQVVEEILKGKHFLKVLRIAFMECRMNSCSPICSPWYVKNRFTYMEPRTVLHEVCYPCSSSFGQSRAPVVPLFLDCLRVQQRKVCHPHPYVSHSIATLRCVSRYLLSI